MEKKNQKAFEGMVFDLISQWDNIQFELDRHNQSQVFLISQRSAEKILDLVADQRAKIRKEIETEQEFKQKLDRIQDITDAWIDTQKRFLCCALFLTGQLKQRVENLYERFLVEQGRYQSMISTCLKDPRVVSFCEVPEILSDFRDMRIKFELIASQCDNHLNDARIAFPRFFFVSNEQLIEMLSMRGIKEFKRFYKLLFDSVDALELDEKQNVKGMTSIQSEYVPWPRTLVWSDSQISLESQLSDIEILMREAVRYHIKMARRTYPESDRKQWVLNWPSMAVLCVTQIYWTFEAAQAISDDEGKALTDYYRKCNEQLEEIVLMLRGSLSDLLRQSIGTLVVTEVHARDSTRMLIEENVSSLAEFAWMAQLRYYWEEENVLCGMMRARRKYGYEYLGVESRVLGTPLTDRCYRTLMCALQLNIGGSLEGPAGTGKSETVKGLAQCFAVRVTTINCSDGLDCMFTSKMLKGAAYCGCWICFDEFNRIDIEIMSIIALQVLHIQRAWKSQTSEIVFEGSCLKLNHGYAIFSTLNPVCYCLSLSVNAADAFLGVCRRYSSARLLEGALQTCTNVNA
jgi:dynein heavy chain, axonemal